MARYRSAAQKKRGNAVFGVFLIIGGVVACLALYTVLGGTAAIGLGYVFVRWP